jgi:hypothetical protein
VLLTAKAVVGLIEFELVEVDGFGHGMFIKRFIDKGKAGV